MLDVDIYSTSNSEIGVLNNYAIYQYQSYSNQNNTIIADVFLWSAGLNCTHYDTHNLCLSDQSCDYGYN